MIAGSYWRRRRRLVYKYIDTVYKYIDTVYKYIDRRTVYKYIDICNFNRIVTYLQIFTNTKKIIYEQMLEIGARKILLSFSLFLFSLSKIIMFDIIQIVQDWCLK